jgi:hypothetical protein
MQAHPHPARPPLIITFVQLERRPSLLATAYNSEGMPDGLHFACWILYGAAAITAFIAIVMRIQGGWVPKVSRGVALAAVVVGLIPLAWHASIYRMDNGHFCLEGRPRSGSLTSLAVPSFPVLIGCILLLTDLRKRRTGTGRRGI